MKKILFIFSSTEFYSGADAVVCQLGLHLGKDFSVSGIFPNSDGLCAKWKEKGLSASAIPFVSAGRRTLAFPRVFLYLTVNLIYSALLILHILRHKVDILHINDIYNLHAMIAGSITGRKIVMHVHAGVFPSKRIKKIVLFIAESLAHRLVFVSSVVAGLWYGKSPFSRKAVVIHNMCPDQHKFDPRKYAIKQKNYFVVGMVSKMCREKGHRYFIETAKILRKSGCMDIKYYIVGGKIGGHETYYDEILRIINSSDMSEDFILHGMTDNVAEILSEMNVFVHTPDFEDPFPTVVLEAMMMEKPVVCFRIGGIPEQFKDGESGILVPYRDVECLADEIAGLYKNKSRCEALGRQARIHVMSKFSENKTVEKFKDVYDILLRS